MAYNPPGVTVTESFAAALPALAVFSLPNVVVGPVFTVFTNATAGAGSYNGASATLSYPQLVAGSLVDSRPPNPMDLTGYPVAINFKNAIVTLSSATTGAVVSPNLNTFVDSTGTPFANVNPGDLIVVASGGDAGTYTIRTVTDANHVQINETFSVALSGISYSLERNLGATGTNLNIPTSTAGVVVAPSGVTLPASLTTTVAPFGVVPIVSAEVLISYRTQRLERSNDIYPYASTQALQADFGIDQIVPQSPAVFGAYLALSNAVTPTNLLALNGSYYMSETIAYQDAIAILALNDVYAISVMTQNTAVHTALKAHVDGMSMPHQKMERVGIINRTLVTSQVIDGPYTAGSTDVTGLILTSVGSTFITDGVVPGCFIAVTAPSLNAGKYVVASVDSQTQVTLVTAIGSSVSGITFTANQNLANSEQAAVIAAYANSFADSRMILTWPDVVNIPVGNTIMALPGYFLNCAVGALTTGLPTQQGLTNLSVAVYSGVVHSTKYFSNDDLNTIAGGGVMVFVQDILNQTPLYIRHQLTTNTSSVLFQEYSITKNVDFIAKFIRKNHLPFIGQYNIVDQTFDDLKTNAQGIMTYLKSGTLLPKIGGVINSGKLASIVQNPSELDGIQETWDISVPVPLNYLDITLVIS